MLSLLPARDALGGSWAATGVVLPCRMTPTAPRGACPPEAQRAGGARVQPKQPLSHPHGGLSHNAQASPACACTTSVPIFCSALRLHVRVQQQRNQGSRLEMLKIFSAPSPSSSLGNCFQSLYVLKTNMKGKTLLCLQLSEQKLEFPELFSEVLIFSPRPSLYRTQICSPLHTDREGTALKSWAALFIYLSKIKTKNCQYQ